MTSVHVIAIDQNILLNENHKTSSQWWGISKEGSLQRRKNNNKVEEIQLAKLVARSFASNRYVFDSVIHSNKLAGP